MPIPDQSQNAIVDQLPSAFGSATLSGEQERLAEHEIGTDESTWQGEAREHGVNVLRDIHTALAEKEEEILKSVNTAIAQLRVVSNPASYERIEKLLKKFRATRKEAQRLNTYRHWKKIKLLHLRQRKDAFARSILDGEHRTCGDRCSHESTSCRCTICYEKFEDVYATLPCGHVYHYECIMKWHLRTDTCPMCRHNNLQASGGSHEPARSSPTWTEVYGWCDELLAIAPWDLIDNHAAEGKESDEDESDEDESDDEESDEDESDEESSDSESDSDESSSEEEESEGSDNESEDHSAVQNEVHSHHVDASESAVPQSGSSNNNGRSSERRLHLQAPAAHECEEGANIELPAPVQEWLLDRQRRRRRLEHVPSLFWTNEQQQQDEEKRAPLSGSSYTSPENGIERHTTAGHTNEQEDDTIRRNSNERQRGRYVHIYRGDHSLANTALTRQSHSPRQQRPSFATSVDGVRRSSRGHSPTGAAQTYYHNRSSRGMTPRVPRYEDRELGRPSSRGHSSTGAAPPYHHHRSSGGMTPRAVRFEDHELDRREPRFEDRDFHRRAPRYEGRARSGRNVSRQRSMSPPRDPRVYLSTHAIP